MYLSFFFSQQVFAAKSVGTRTREAHIETKNPSVEVLGSLKSKAVVLITGL